MTGQAGTVLWGRQREQAVIDQLLLDVRSGHSRALVLHGEPGIGKTACWTTWSPVLPRRRLHPRPPGRRRVAGRHPDPTKDQLRFVGRIDHGLLGPTRRRLAELLVGRITPASPFTTDPLPPGRWGQPPEREPAAVFVRPDLPVRVRYLGWEAGRLRHAAYRGVA